MTRVVQARTGLKAVEILGRQPDTLSEPHAKVGDLWDTAAKPDGQDHPQLKYAVGVEDLDNANLVSDDYIAVVWVSVDRVDGLAMTRQMWIVTLTREQLHSSSEDMLILSDI
ncbi:hypothetical protein DL764_004085 [Monosporascus ibericus]|uniref:Uncharacterized protein n=1 Tax=Monosporascus ibericus TaxID=155417 RepID=A0A4Q4THK4_9PEZI|nr:hypothetical protein DL764_004085 [Monosporascus ibericus]